MSKIPKYSLYKLCTHDLILAAVFAAAALILLAVFAFSHGTAPGRSVRVTVDGQIYGEYPLDTDQIIELRTDSGFNSLRIQDGQVFMTDADCPDKYCISKGRILRSGETIVCLPHKVVAEIRSGEAAVSNPAGTEEAFDIVAE